MPEDVADGRPRSAEDGLRGSSARGGGDDPEAKSEPGRCTGNTESRPRW